MCIILNHEETILPIQDSLEVNFYIWEHSFQFGASLCGKNLKFIFQGQILFFGGQFLVWENLKSLFWGRILFWGAFSIWANLCMGNLKYFF